MSIPTIFGLLLDACGLSQREGMEFLNVRHDTLKSWAAGRNAAPPGPLAELAELATRIDDAANTRLAEMLAAARQAGGQVTIDLAIAATDDGARAKGWPCVGAQRAVARLVLARGLREGLRFRIVSADAPER